MAELYVIFGTGAFGRAIAEELTAYSVSRPGSTTVHMVNRTGRMEEAPAGVEVIAADLYDPAQVCQVTLGAKVVYQSAQPPINNEFRISRPCKTPSSRD